MTTANVGKNILKGLTAPVSPVSQSIEAVKSLLAWKGRAVDPLPSVVEFAKEGEESRLVLVLSNKKNAYYTVTAKACSCPAATYHQGPCKHQRKHFGVSPPTSPRRCAEVGGSIRPTDSFKPFSLLPGEEPAQEVA